MPSRLSHTAEPGGGPIPRRRSLAWTQTTLQIQVPRYAGPFSSSQESYGRRAWWGIGGSTAFENSSASPFIVGVIDDWGPSAELGPFARSRRTGIPLRMLWSLLLSFPSVLYLVDFKFDRRS